MDDFYHEVALQLQTPDKNIRYILEYDNIGTSYADMS